MARTVTLGDLRGKVRALADIGADSTSGRYPNTRINALINDSWQRAREIAVTAGDGQIFLRQTGPTVMAAGAMDSTSSFQVIRWPTNATQIHGIDVIFATGNIQSLQVMSWSDRNLFANRADVLSPGQLTGPPIGFCIINVGNEVNCDCESGRIAIFPAPDKEYTYTCWYSPVWIDRTDNDHVFLCIDGMEEWTLQDVVIHIAEGDADMQNVAQLAIAEREKAEAQLRTRVNRFQRTGALQRRDVASQQRSRRQAVRWGRR